METGGVEETEQGPFIVQTWDEVETEKARDLFIIDGLVSARSTLIYGEPKAGKSLVTAGILASLVSGEPFLDRNVDSPGTGWRPAICWTDDGGAAEYRSRMSAVLGEESQEVRFYGLPAMTPRLWEQLFDVVYGHGCNFVVFDVLSQLTTGNLNDSTPIAEILNGIRLFTRRNIPVIMVAHESDKFQGADKPMGHTTISGGFRWRLRLTKSKTGVWTVKGDGNRGDRLEVKFTGDVIDVPSFDVISEANGADLRGASNERLRQRGQATMNLNGEIHDYVLANCQHLNQSKTAAELAAKFPNMTVETHRRYLREGNRYGLKHDGKGWASTWGE
ncbi:AAA family ATPase [Microbispora rosea]|uniref:AAA family ATPase n=1 Tax=Microbispora rosea TaxID=58117 RepID=UPI0037C7BAB9